MGTDCIRVAALSLRRFRTWCCSALWCVLTETSICTDLGGVYTTTVSLASKPSKTPTLENYAGRQRASRVRVSRGVLGGGGGGLETPPSSPEEESH